MSNDKEDESRLQEACMGFLGMKRNRQGYTDVSISNKRNKTPSINMLQPQIYWNEDNGVYCCIGQFADHITKNRNASTVQSKNIDKFDEREKMLNEHKARVSGYMNLKQIWKESLIRISTEFKQKPVMPEPQKQREFGQPQLDNKPQIEPRDTRRRVQLQRESEQQSSVHTRESKQKKARQETRQLQEPPRTRKAARHTGQTVVPLETGKNTSRRQPRNQAMVELNKETTAEEDPSEDDHSTENIKALSETEAQETEQKESQNEEAEGEEESGSHDPEEEYEWFCVFCRKITDWKPNIKLDTAVCLTCETEGTNYKEDCASCHQNRWLFTNRGNRCELCVKGVCLKIEQHEDINWKKADVTNTEQHCHWCRIETKFNIYGAIHMCQECFNYATECKQDIKIKKGGKKDAEGEEQCMNCDKFVWDRMWTIDDATKCKECSPQISLRKKRLAKQKQEQKPVSAPVSAPATPPKGGRTTRSNTHSDEIELLRKKAALTAKRQAQLKAKTKDVDDLEVDDFTSEKAKSPKKTVSFEKAKKTKNDENDCTLELISVEAGLEKENTKEVNSKDKAGKIEQTTEEIEQTTEEIATEEVVKNVIAEKKKSPNVKNKQKPIKSKDQLFDPEDGPEKILSTAKPENTWITKSCSQTSDTKVVLNQNKKIDKASLDGLKKLKSQGFNVLTNEKAALKQQTFDDLGQVRNNNNTIQLKQKLTPKELREKKKIDKDIERTKKQLADLDEQLKLQEEEIQARSPRSDTINAYLETNEKDKLEKLISSSNKAKTPTTADFTPKKPEISQD